MPLTLAQAKSLRPGDTLYSMIHTDSRGQPACWRVSGKPKVWKTRPDEVLVPVKHGLYEHDHLSEDQLDLVTLDYDEAAMSARTYRAALEARKHGS